jgi:hypothetical protein
VSALCRPGASPRARTQADRRGNQPRAGWPARCYLQGAAAPAAASEKQGLLSPLVWPPSAAWLQDNALPLLFQFDPGDGKVYQNDIGLLQEQRGRFFSVDGVEAPVNVEYFFLDADSVPAGAEGVGTRMRDNVPEQWATLDAFWARIAPEWGAGTAVAINGCANYHDAPMPGVL